MFYYLFETKPGKSYILLGLLNAQAQTLLPSPESGNIKMVHRAKAYSVFIIFLQEM